MVSATVRVARLALRFEVAKGPRIPAERENARYPFGGIAGQTNPAVGEEECEVRHG